MSWLKPYLTRKMMVILLLGISSGFPRALCAGKTLRVWLYDSGLTLQSIGLASIISLPYIMKFLWSPLFDAVKLPYLSKLLGRRRAWIAAIQIILALSIILLGITSPEINPLYTAVFAFIVSFLSASQDINIDAYRVEYLEKEDYGYGSATAVFGYRIGMIISGAGALFISQMGVGWHLIYIFLALTVLFGLAGVVMGSKPLSEYRQKIPDKIFRHYIIEPLTNFMQKNGWGLFICAVLLYKLPDAALGSLSNIFYLKIGFTKSDLGIVMNIFGLIVTIIGSLAGGILIRQLGLYKSLVTGCILQAVTVLFFCVFVLAGKNYPLFVFAVGIEDFSSGIGDICLVVFISNLCNKEFTATQYALLSSISAVGIIVCGMFSGFVANATGWFWFFGLSAATAIPGLAMIYLARDKIRLLTAENDQPKKLL